MIQPVFEVSVKIEILEIDVEIFLSNTPVQLVLFPTVDNIMILSLSESHLLVGGSTNPVLLLSHLLLRCFLCLLLFFFFFAWFLDLRSFCAFPFFAFFPFFALPLFFRPRRPLERGCLGCRRLPGQFPGSKTVKNHINADVFDPFTCFFLSFALPLRISMTFCSGGSSRSCKVFKIGGSRSRFFLLDISSLPLKSVRAT